MSIKHQADIHATKTVKAKLKFDREDQSHGAVIKGYQTDNGISNASDLMEELLKKQQKIGFSGAGTSNQNGAAERTIKTVVTMARIMLMHAAIICPEETLSTDLWPMSMDYDVWVYNRIPDMQYGLFPIEILSRSRFEPV